MCRPTLTTILWLICKIPGIAHSPTKEKDVDRAELTFVDRMQSVFGLHNNSKVVAYCYATTPSDQSPYRQKIEREAPVFLDVSGWSADKLVERIVQDGIHILVNLNGYTRGARNEIFAARPAPIQMSFMGFAGTLGAEWCDYLLADSTAVPPGTLRPYRRNRGPTDLLRDQNEDDGGDWMYSENIIFCRDTFFCCDHKQSSPEEEKGLTWEDEQRRRWEMRKSLFPNLPDDAVILGNFNQLYKVGKRYSQPSGYIRFPILTRCIDGPYNISVLASDLVSCPKGRPLAPPLPRPWRRPLKENSRGMGGRTRCQPHHLHRCGAQESAHISGPSV